MPTRPPGMRELAGLGTGIAVLVAGGLVLGWFIDSRARTSPVFVLVGVAAGIAAACFYAYRLLKKYL